MHQTVPSSAVPQSETQAPGAAALAAAPTAPEKGLRTVAFSLLVDRALAF
ncbi:hypothetical protein [Burkholderia sp. WAC0059]|nr:hypothetical protein [Burkholderia sp. WAC0059]